MKTEGRPQGFRPQQTHVAPAQEDQTAEALATLSMSQGMVRTQTQYQTAITVQKKRDMVAVIKAIEFESGEMGESFCYSWRQKCKPGAPEDEGDGHTTIEGMSINGAMILIRCFGNAALPTDLLSETPTHFYFVSTFIDLETGFTLSRTFRQRKSGGPGGGMGDDRKADIAYQIGQSKSARNVVDKAMPSWLRDRAIECAKNNAAKQYENVPEWTPIVVDYFAKLGVQKTQLERYLSRPMTSWSKFDILKLRMLAKAIKEKETTAEEAFATPEEATGDVAMTESSTAPTVTVDTTGETTSETTEPVQEKKREPGDIAAAKGAIDAIAAQHAAEAAAASQATHAQATETAASNLPTSDVNGDPDWMRDPAKPQVAQSAQPKKPAEPSFTPPKPKDNKS